jgi:hypothetical protein
MSRNESLFAVYAAIMNTPLDNQKGDSQWQNSSFAN